MNATVTIPNGKISAPWRTCFNNGSTSDAQTQVPSEERVYPPMSLFC